MIKLHSLTAQEPVKVSYAELLDSFMAIDGYVPHKLEDSYGGREVYGFSFGDIHNKPVMYIQGQIHGAHEWRTAHWVSQFMRVLSDPEMSEHTTILDKLRAQYAFYFIPCVNPDGYDNNIYTNDNGVPVDCNFDWMWEETAPPSSFQKGDYPFSEPEARNIRDVVNELLPVSFVCTHTWGGHEGSMVRHPQNETYYPLIFDYYKSTSLYDANNVGNEFGRKNTNASAYNWAGELLSKSGRRIIASVLETGSEETNLKQAEVGVNSLLMKCVYVDHYLRKNTQEIY